MPRHYTKGGVNMDIVKIPIDELTPDPNNAKDHPQWQIEQIKNSIEQFGNLDPIGVWGDDNLIVEGHGRYVALQELGYTEAECIRLDWLTEEERTAYALAHNKLTMNSGFIPEMLDVNLEAVGEIDMSLFGFRADDWFSNRERNDDSRQEGNDEYNEFLDKFEQPKTTDDCYTPDKVYDAVVGWVENEYGVDRKDFVRPFYPGGDYEHYKYPKDCIVVDNPPFSILSQILNFYKDNGIKFFLFAPALTLFSSSSSSACAVGAGGQVVYENKANVSTSFLTNLEDDRFRTAPTLYKAINDAMNEILAETARELPKNDYPDTVVTSTKLSYFSKYGVDFRVSRKESEQIRQLDAQKEKNKGIFGSGYLISEKAAAEKAAAEKWELSDREWEIVHRLGGD